jgi:hypothetical protein
MYLYMTVHLTWPSWPFKVMDIKIRFIRQKCSLSDSSNDVGEVKTNVTLIMRFHHFLMHSWHLRHMEWISLWVGYGMACHSSINAWDRSFTILHVSSQCVPFWLCWGKIGWTYVPVHVVNAFFIQECMNTAYPLWSGIVILELHSIKGNNVMQITAFSEW